MHQSAAREELGHARHIQFLCTGPAADTGSYSRAAIERAEEPKELFVINGKWHVDLYDDTSKSIPMLADLMEKSLCT
jgi:hypothetical protein